MSTSLSENALAGTIPSYSTASSTPGDSAGAGVNTTLSAYGLTVEHRDDETPPWEIFHIGRCNECFDATCAACRSWFVLYPQQVSGSATGILNVPSPGQGGSLPEGVRAAFIESSATLQSESRSPATPVDLPPISGSYLLLVAHPSNPVNAAGNSAILQPAINTSDSLILSPNGRMTISLLSPTPCGKTKVIVSSDALQQASWAFYSMLAENGVDLRRCDTNALLTVLNAIHHNGHSVPKAVNSEQLLAIAKISEKYGLYEVLYPWVKLWMPRLKNVALTEGQEDWIFIAWAFREHEIFYELSRHLILEMDERKPFNTGLPHTVEGAITDRKDAIADQLLDIIKWYLRRYGNINTPCECNRALYNRTCNSQVIAARCLHSAFPGGPDDVLEMSLCEISSRLHSLSVFEFARGLPCTPPSRPRQGFCGIHPRDACQGQEFHVCCPIVSAAI
ncbi:hypothetical protein K440DRAFT_667873 [Wilcoxina mikolae CBS 423.85]|nr:hypothetical protein K440DRAFT_667873 [Wilcoxina mikolae CBS 423.85]